MTRAMQGPCEEIEQTCLFRWAALESGIVERVQAYIAPKLFGGKAAPSPVGGMGVAVPDDAVRLKNTTVIPLGDDFLLESEVDTDVHGDR